jgi:hypothetical protein
MRLLSIGTPKLAVLRDTVGHIFAPITFMLLLTRITYGASSAPILTQLDYIKGILTQVGPALSAVLFVIAGIFYAIGQMLPPDKKANFHTTAVNIIIGAVVVGVLSVASTSLAVASTHLLSNLTSGSTNALT